MLYFSAPYLNFLGRESVRRAGNTEVACIPLWCIFFKPNHTFSDASSGRQQMAWSKIFNKAASWRHVFRFPKNVTPNRVWMKQTPTRTDIYSTNKGESAHSHSVLNRGEHHYSRTQGGTEVLNVPSGGGCCPKCGRPRG